MPAAIVSSISRVVIKSLQSVPPTGDCSEFAGALSGFEPNFCSSGQTGLWLYSGLSPRLALQDRCAAARGDVGSPAMM